MNFIKKIEHLDPVNEGMPPVDKDMLLNLILNGNPLASPPVKPLRYGDILTPTILNNELKIVLDDPSSVINPILSDMTSSLNDINNGDYNCILYDNKLGLIDDYNKNPLICSNNIESKCTLSAFSDNKILGVTDNNKKTYTEFHESIGKTGLNLQKEYVSCGDRVNKLMWIYKDANSLSSDPDAIGIPVDQCGLVNLNTSDLSTSTSSINALCRLPMSYALIKDNVTNAGYKCKQLPGPDGVPSIAGGPGVPTSLSLETNPDTGLNILKCNNL